MKQQLDPKVAIGVVVGILALAGAIVMAMVNRPGAIPPSEDVSQVSQTYQNDLNSRSGGAGKSEEQMRQESNQGTTPVPEGTTTGN